MKFSVRETSLVILVIVGYLLVEFSAFVNMTPIPFSGLTFLVTLSVVLATKFVAKA